MLYDHPELYDALLKPTRHLPFYAALARRLGGPVLELACGTGQLAVPLAAEGFDVAGVDLAEPMLAAAHRRARDAGVDMELVRGDMRDVALGRRFALVFIARNSLLHLHSPADFAGFFDTVRRHLAPDGVLAFDVFNPDVRILARHPGQRVPAIVAESERWGSLTVHAGSDYDAATQVNHVTWYVSTADRPDAWIFRLALRSIFPQELPLLAAAHGFRLVERAGDFDGEPFASDSARQVCTVVPA